MSQLGLSIKKKKKILKITDFINYKNILFVRNLLIKENLLNFNEMFPILNQSHAYNTGAVTYNILDVLPVRTAHFGESCLKFQTSQTWNDLQINFNSDTLTYSHSELKKPYLRHTLQTIAKLHKINTIVQICQLFFSIP